MFAIGAGFSALQLKALICGMIIIITYLWAVFNIKGHFNLFSHDEITGMDLLQAVVKISIICLILTAIVALSF